MPYANLVYIGIAVMTVPRPWTLRFWPLDHLLRVLTTVYAIVTSIRYTPT